MHARMQKLIRLVSVIPEFQCSIIRRSCGMALICVYESVCE